MEESEKLPVTPAAIKQMEAARDIDGLLGLLDPSVAVLYRRSAAKALASIAKAKVAPDLAARLNTDPDRGVRQSLVKALGRLGDDQGLVALLKTLEDRDLQVCQEAALALSRFNSPAAYDALLEALHREGGRDTWQTRHFAAHALGKMGDRRAVPTLIASLRNETDLVVPAIAEALGELGDRQAVSSLKAIRHTTPHRKGAECASCQAIDKALKRLDSL